MTTTTRSSSTLRNGALLAGVGLAGAWLYVRAKTRQAEREHPPEGRFVEVDGVRLHYIERGEGPVLVLLHGNGVYSSDFDNCGLIERAAEHYRVIAFDRPGFGYSERPRGTVWTPQNQARLLHHALQEIDVDSAIVAGHSWGTLVALAMALEVPDFVRGLVLMSGYYYPSLRLDAPLQSASAIPVVGDLMRYTFMPLLGRLMWPVAARHAFAPRRVPQAFRDLPVWMMLRPKQLRASAAESALMVPAAMALARRYPELKVPVTIIAGTQDKIADFSHNAERLNERIAHSELQLEPGVGHMTHYADPGKVLAAVDALAAQVGEPVPIRSPRADALARAAESGV
jgi:pimeloyl-ACP methyl ester carboxylesterase